MKKPKTTAASYVALRGSEKAPPAVSTPETLNPLDAASVTIRVRRRKSIEAALKKGRVMSRDEYDKQYGASEEDMALVEAFASDNHLSIVESDRSRRSVIVKGTIAD